MASVHPEKEPADAGMLSAMSLWFDDGEKWSFIYMAHMQGAGAARDALIAAMSTVGVVDALMLSFTITQLSSPPDALQEEDMGTHLNAWYWAVYISTISAIVSVILATIIIAYAACVVDQAVVAYLKRVRTPYSLCVAGFIVCVLLQGMGMMVVIKTYVSLATFAISIAVIGTIFLMLLLFFLQIDSQTYLTNLRYFDDWKEEQQRQQRQEQQQGDKASVAVRAPASNDN